MSIIFEKLRSRFKLCVLLSILHFKKANAEQEKEAFTETPVSKIQTEKLHVRAPGWYRQNVTKNIVTNVIEVSDSRSTDSDDDYIKMLHDYYVMKLLPNKLNLL